MHSSISDSDRLNAQRAIWLLAVALVVYLVASEIAMCTVLPRLSETLQRETRDYRAAVQTLAPGRARPTLVVGNSLLLLGVDRVRLTRAMAPEHVTEYPIENTSYLDWYFGLRRLFAEGARPRVVVLCLSATNMLSDATADEVFARLLMRIEDLPAVVRASHLDMMTASSYFFANRSALLGYRATLHNGLMSRWLPHAELLARYLAIQPPPPLDTSTAGAERVVERLRRIRELSVTYGADFVFLVPPSPNRQDPAEAIRAAANSAGISVLVPYTPGEMPRNAFSDGFHLNPNGAALFTDRVAGALRALADSPGVLSSQP